MDSVIQVENLSKELTRSRSESFLNQNLRETLLRFHSRLTNSNRGRPEHFFALKDISFSLQPGDNLMLIGNNGAGKSTLLKILARVTKPTSGKAFIRGRLVAVLGIGSGFHPDLTGRENIYLYGVFLGMKRREISAIFDRIVSFAEVGPFIDSPVKHYSTGMLMRLGFAVATHVSADVMLLDEVLAVGDIEFQRKCLQRIGEIQKLGVSTIMVSHNIQDLNAICNRAMLLDTGRIKLIGDIDSVFQEYLKGSTI